MPGPVPDAIYLPVKVDCTTHLVAETTYLEYGGRSRHWLSTGPRFCVPAMALRELSRRAVGWKQKDSKWDGSNQHGTAMKLGIKVDGILSLLCRECRTSFIAASPASTILCGTLRLSPWNTACQPEADGITVASLSLSGTMNPAEPGFGSMTCADISQFRSKIRRKGTQVARVEGVGGTQRRFMESAVLAGHLTACRWSFPNQKPPKV